MKKSFSLFYLAASLVSVCLLCSCDKDDGESALSDWEGMIKEEEKIPEGEIYFKTRGVVCGWADVCNPEKLDYIKLAKEHNLNTFSIYNMDFRADEWKEFTAKCQVNGIKIEFEEHMMSFVLPRDLFSTHPNYFRMNEQFVRTNDANGCPSNKEALDIVYKKAIELGKLYKPTNHKYYFWLDDGGGICHCGDCSKYNAADQALIYENTILKALKTIDPEAQLAHLCYYNTVDAPNLIKPEEDIFFEFAPFGRDKTQPMSATWAVGDDGRTHGDYLQALANNLKIFPKETAQVLEYWMDDSLFSGWDPNNLKEVPWSLNMVNQDLKTYASYGIRNIMCYSAYVGPNYVEQFGYPKFLEEYADAIYNFEK